MKTFSFCASIAVVLSACSSSHKYDATGTFEATEVIVSAEATGKLLSFDVEEGDTLRPRVTVGVVDTMQLYLSKLQLEATRRSVYSQRPDLSKQLAALHEQLNTAVRERDRVERLLRDGAAQRKQLDDWEAQVAVIRKQITAQESTLGNSLNSLNDEGASLATQIMQIDDRLQKSLIASPIRGTVLAKYVEPGEWTTAGRPLFKVADTENMYLRAYVTSRQLSAVRVGQPATVYADYGDDTVKAYKGTVTWISQASEFTPKTILTDDERADLVYAVKIAVAGDGFIKIGMYGGVSFE